jgi:hypothetical protein
VEFIDLHLLYAELQKLLKAYMCELEKHYRIVAIKKKKFNY